MDFPYGQPWLLDGAYGTNLKTAGLSFSDCTEQFIPVSYTHLLFVLLNTASIQLLPTTIATLRLQNGAQSPLDVLPAILLSSLVSVLVGLMLAQCCKQFSKGPKPISERM